MKNIYEVIRGFIKDIDSDITVMFSDDEFFAFSKQKYVNIPFDSFKYFNDADALLDQFIKEQFNTTVDTFLISILHEVGHIMTYTPELESERSFLYSMLMMDYKEEEWEKYTRMYFAIPSEFEATKWGVEFYQNNKEACDSFLESIGLK